MTPIAAGKWTGKRLADGQPDVQGHWSNTIANHNNWTDPQGGVPGDPGRNGPPKTPRNERAPSRVSDPPDGAGAVPAVGAGGSAGIPRSTFTIP